MRRCYLHIGMYKAGSTAIQRAFRGYDDGRIAMADLPRANHSMALKTLTPTMDGRMSPADMAQYRDRLDAVFAQRDRDIVFSAENLRAGLADADRRAILDKLRMHFDAVTVVAYIRDPVSFARSAAQQSTKRQYHRFDWHAFRPEYRERLAFWLNAMKGANDRVILRPFRVDGFYNGRLTDDFAHHLGMDAGRARDVTANTSLRFEAFVILYSYQALVMEGLLPNLQELGLSPREIVSELRHFGGKRLEMSEPCRAAFLEDITDDLAWVETQLGAPLPLSEPLGDGVQIENEADILSFLPEFWPEFVNFTHQHDAKALEKICQRMDRLVPAV